MDDNLLYPHHNNLSLVTRDHDLNSSHMMFDREDERDDVTQKKDQTKSKDEYDRLIQARKLLKDYKSLAVKGYDMNLDILLFWHTNKEHIAIFKFDKMFVITSL